MRLTKWAARLYPRWWRERYGEEFAALLEDARPGFGGAFDVARGAMAMQMTTWPVKRVVALGTLLGLAAGLSSALWNPTYESTVVLKSATPMDNNAEYATAVANTFTRSKLTNIVRRSDLYRAERNRMPLEELLIKMQRDVIITSHGSIKDGLHELELRFRYSDEAMSKKTAERLGAELIEQARANGLEIQELRDAAPPTKRVFPNLGAFTGVGILGGFIVTGLFALGLWVGRRQLSTKPE